MKPVKLIVKTRSETYPIIIGSGLIKDLSNKRELPFKARIDTKESVRPIFWANNMDKYIKRTEKWNKYVEICGVETILHALRNVEFYLLRGLHHVRECLCRCGEVHCAAPSN